MTMRNDALVSWLEKSCDLHNFQLTPLDGDASLRHYFRVRLPNQTYILMDAPPDKEDCHSFVAVAQSFAKSGVLVPQIIRSDLDQGFLLLSDLGDLTFLKALKTHDAEMLYKKAIDSLLLIQRCQGIEHFEIPTFDAQFIAREIQLFVDWFMIKHLQTNLSKQDNDLLLHAFQHLTEAILKQSRICVHRDYHSRNLMLLSNNEIGVLDFQDAVWGPITYDLVSLLKDCYIAWPQPLIESWVKYYYDKATQHKILVDKTYEDFLCDFHLMGIQRHLKAIGIFARLNHFYHKPQYLNDIPRTLNYIVQVLNRFPQYAAFNDWLKINVVNHVESQIEQIE